MRQHTPIARKLVAIIGLAALLPPAPLHAAGAPLTEPGAPGATHAQPEPDRGAAPIANEIALTNPSSAFQNDPDPRLSITAMTTPSWLGLSDSRLLPGTELSIVQKPSMSQSAVQAFQRDEGTSAIAVAAVAAAMVAMVAVAVATAVMQAEVLSD